MEPKISLEEFIRQELYKVKPSSDCSTLDNNKVYRDIMLKALNKGYAKHYTEVDEVYHRIQDETNEKR